MLDYLIEITKAHDILDNNNRNNHPTMSIVDLLDLLGKILLVP